MNNDEQLQSTMSTYDFSKKEDYDRLTKNISRSLQRLGVSESPQDFAQEYVCGVLDGKHRHQTLEQFVIDVLRKRSGRKGSSGYDQRLALAFANENNSGDFQIPDRRNTPEHLDTRIDSDRNRGYIKSREFELYSEGYSMKEIGEIFGVSVSRISQRLNKVKATVEKHEVLNHLQMSPEARRWAKGFL